MPLGSAPSADSIEFDSDGLVPCVAQDANTGEILMLANMNREALDLTIETGEVHFWSRSRQSLWRKGDTSGNVLKLSSLRYDCDADALLAIVEPAGPACHTGERSCFHRTLGEPAVATHEAMPVLGRMLADRQRFLPDDSYTTELFRGGIEMIGAKVEEEAEEVARAAREESTERVREEAADVLYHLAVLLQARGLTFADALEVLVARMGPSPSKAGEAG